MTVRSSTSSGFVPGSATRLGRIGLLLALVTLGGSILHPTRAHEPRQADPPAPGDAMMAAHLGRLARLLDDQSRADFADATSWRANLPRLRQEYRYMLGLDPLPERTPLHPVVVGTIQRDGYVVDRLHFQSRPGLYVTANLYKPAVIPREAKLPAVLYVCGHSNMGAYGNKTNYQSHGIWFARHGYVCLTLDTLQLGEIAGIHHGTYREGRWHWISRGYTPAGVECWNGLRALDLLETFDFVDPARIGVTGISGGGAATFWIAAADPRVAIAAPVSGMADLEYYCAEAGVNGHCDCMFLHNTFQWPWTRIAALIAPRPLLFVNSDADPIFPMDANERVINRLERVYRLFGAGDKVDAVVSVGGHAYRADIRRSVYEFFNRHLKRDANPVEDSENDLVLGEGRLAKSFPIEPQALRVFATPDNLPADAINHRVDDLFISRGQPQPPTPANFAERRASLLAELNRVSYAGLPRPIRPAAPLVDRPGFVQTEEGIAIPLTLAAQDPDAPSGTVALWVNLEDQSWTPSEEDRRRVAAARHWVVQPRGIGPTRWTRSNPPNTIERALLLLGRTADLERVYDIAACVDYLKQADAAAENHEPVVILAGCPGNASLLATHAVLVGARVDRLTLNRPTPTHDDPNAPQLLNVLRVADVPDLIGLLVDRPLDLIDPDPTIAQAVARARQAFSDSKPAQMKRDGTRR